ncbi:MAG: MaoC family dehydratase [Acidobacteriota bacterium]|nr:MaoC family dehydratase [Blastocatellia bacterium]MDW8412246.1 MaoC family dehydratase [Acidobacteriota bacterium]
MTIAEFSVGRSASFSKTITAEDIDAFASICGDRNPIHFDEEYAAKTRFGRRIAHGLLTASFISTVIGMHLPGPGAIYLSQELNFLKPVFIGDTVTAKATVTSINTEKRILTLATECTNQNNEVVVKGEAKILYEPV